MDQEELTKFERVFAELPPRRREVLVKLLAGETDEEIAQSLGIHTGTVRKQISTLCNDFGLKEESGERRPRRADLTALVAKYKPELLGADASISVGSVVDDKHAFFSNLLNPFIPLNDRIENPQQLFGREQQIQDIFEVLNSGSSVALIGDEGIGKSSLLCAICQQAKSYLLVPRESVFLDLNNVQNEDEFYLALCQKVDIPESRGYLLKLYLEENNKQILLALDNMGKMAREGLFTRQVRDQLRSLAEGKNAPLKLILAANESLNTLFKDSQDDGKTSPLAGICYEENLKPWDELTIRAFIKSRLASTSVSFTEDEIDWLIRESKGNPKQLMQLCFKTYSRYMESL